MPQLALDSIIFGLQRFGGISNFWRRLIEAAVNHPNISAELLMPTTIRAADLPRMAKHEIYLDDFPTSLARYLPARVWNRKAIFHTSYYRIPRRGVDRYITSVYDFTYERYFSALPKLIHHQQKRISISCADLAVCISRATRDDLLNQFPKIDPAKAVVIPLGVDTTHFYPEPGQVLAGPYVLFVGQRAGYKRFDLAASAVARTKDVSLMIAGPALTEEEKTSLEKVLPGRWIEESNVSTTRLRQLYSNAFAFLFPSDYEGFGLPILEAMACDCPVIAANRSSFPEVAGDAALLVSKQDPEAYSEQLRSLENAELRSRLIIAGRKQAGCFTWDRTFAELFHLYGLPDDGGMR